MFFKLRLNKCTRQLSIGYRIIYVNICNNGPIPIDIDRHFFACEETTIFRKSWAILSDAASDYDPSFLRPSSLGGSPPYKPSPKHCIRPMWRQQSLLRRSVAETLFFLLLLPSLPNDTGLQQPNACDFDDWGGRSHESWLKNGNGS